jgi:uncharacterized protein YbjQ (UPF0145 family)
MQKCPKCGAEVSESADFCSACGTQTVEGFRRHGLQDDLKKTIPHNLVTTAFDLTGYRIVSNLGLVRGIVVRSRSVVGTIGASLQTLVGGDITLFSELCETTRNDAFERMLQHAAELGANAVIGVRYDATEIMNGVTEVLAYGTAVVVNANER